MAAHELPADYLSSAAGHWRLQRYPLRSHDPLQAWDSGDVLLHQRMAAHSSQLPLLVNDQFGALAVACQQPRIIAMSDSYISTCGWQHNLKINQLATEIVPITGLDTVPAGVDLVVLKLPKSSSLLQFQLQQIAASLSQPIQLFAAAKSKLFTPAIRALFEQYCDQVSVSLIEKKARVLSAQLRPLASAAATPAPMTCWHDPAYPLQLCQYAGVFARKQLDIGARLLLDNLPAAGAEQVIDLGCGNGVLGLRYAQLSPQSEVLWVDESYLAVASCQHNITLNLGASAHYQCHVDDCLSQQADASADLILCNPPFHQEHAITTHIAQQMFRDSKRVLRYGGELRVVANRHLAYHLVLERLFGGVTVVASNPKFVVLSARR
ncbi:class I SAM-dependent methyltransferase [Pseudidiomarina mangrovi]|uniref:class I SAM-dependent methyltransferase n=1 Tax=Pseudidiomarina mangrovi TaxID=2487133 RepID=UPI000FCA00AD|nr:methyltransferase [Pseudidiomarina mangrovi]